MQATSLRNGTKIIFQGELYVVVQFSHHTPGNKRGFIQASLKSIKTGKIIQNKFSSNENVERAVLDPKMCQFLYHDGDGYHFMEMETYNSFTLDDEMIGDDKFFLIENMEIQIQFYEDKPISPEIPKSVVLKVTDSPPFIKGDSVSNNLKPAVCETGLKVQVPIFIEEGESIKVNTETKEYQGRA